MVPQEIMDEYDLVIKDNGNVYMMICKVMYVLKEAGILDFTNLVKNMAPYAYSQMKYTPGLWRHNTRSTIFTFYVDDPGTKYFSKDDVHHLINANKYNYEVTIDCTGSLYIAINLYWNYTASPSYVELSMKSFYVQVRTKFDHLIPKKISMPPTPGRHQSMARKLLSNLRKLKPHLYFEMKENKLSNTSWTPSSITQKSTRASKPHSTKFHPSNQKRHKKQ